jgi:hypothetical protein
MNTHGSTGTHCDAGHAPPGLLLTGHAAVRMRQRGICQDALQCLLSYGRREHDHRGAEVVVHDRETREQVRRFESAEMWRAVERTRELYAVVSSDGRVITAGHRVRRVIRDRSLVSLRPSRGRACNGVLRHGQ